MAEVHAGIVTAAEVNGPMDVGQGMSLRDLLHPSSGATWALIWFLVAVALLFFL